MAAGAARAFQASAGQRWRQGRPDRQGARQRVYPEKSSVQAAFPRVGEFGNLPGERLDFAVHLDAAPGAQVAPGGVAAAGFVGIYLHVHENVEKLSSDRSDTFDVTHDRRSSRNFLYDVFLYENSTMTIAQMAIRGPAYRAKRAIIPQHATRRP